MDAETFKMVDGILADQGYHDDRSAAVAILEVGVQEGTLRDAAWVVADRYALQIDVIIEWYAEVLNRRVQESLHKMKKLTEIT